MYRAVLAGAEKAHGADHQVASHAVNPRTCQSAAIARSLSRAWQPADLVGDGRPEHPDLSNIESNRRNRGQRRANSRRSDSIAPSSCTRAECGCRASQSYELRPRPRGRRSPDRRRGRLEAAVELADNNVAGVGRQRSPRWMADYLPARTLMTPPPSATPEDGCRRRARPPVAATRQQAASIRWRPCPSPIARLALAGRNEPGRPSCTNGSRCSTRGDLTLPSRPRVSRLCRTTRSPSR